MIALDRDAARCASRTRRPAPSSARTCRAAIGRAAAGARREQRRCSGSSSPPAPSRLAAGRDEWREQLDLAGRLGPPHADVRLHAAAGRGRQRHGGYVIVFDDITALLQAQRDAAWGEVARRLAHEIKNPLTPIQLSAERMRRTLPRHHDDRAMREMLERATHTIVQQVEAMKQMVNAFSEYARAPEMEMTRFGLNQLVAEVADLYRSQEPRRAGRPARTRPDRIDRDRGGPRARAADRSTICVTNALEALEGARDPASRDRRRGSSRAGDGRLCAEITVV